eukprot:scaffold5624_cov107-Isochrysis_galbana.AAC.1
MMRGAAACLGSWRGREGGRAASPPCRRAAFCVCAEWPRGSRSRGPHSPSPSSQRAGAGEHGRGGGRGGAQRRHVNIYMRHHHHLT